MQTARDAPNCAPPSASGSEAGNCNSALGWWGHLAGPDAKVGRVAATRERALRAC